MGSNHYFLELEPPAERLRHAPHVVIVGGGFAGVHACKALAKADVRITLIDKRNFNLFQPLLIRWPQVWSQEVMWPHLCANWWASKTTCRCCWERSPR